jgi:methionyl-tRNA formyltransferase
MKIIFMGTPQFSVAPLQALVDAGHDILLVIAQPDKINNRGNKIIFSPVKKRALDLNLKVEQPEKIKGNIELISELESLKPDCIVVSAYGRILPKEILNIPKLGCINIHASLLPKYRGAAPIQWSILDGEEYTGVSIMKMEEGLDTGPVYVMEKTPILEKTGEDLFNELSEIGSRLLIDTLVKLEDGKITAIPQDEASASYARMINKEDGFLDFTKKPIEVTRTIRALYPSTKTYTTYKGNKMIVTEAKALNEVNFKKSGTITEVSKEGIKISCGGSTLLITRLQFPGKNEMKVSDYLIGNKIELLEILK